MATRNTGCAAAMEMKARWTPRCERGDAGQLAGWWGVEGGGIIEKRWRENYSVSWCVHVFPAARESNILLEGLRTGVEVVPRRRRRWRHTDWQLVSSWLTWQAAEAPHQVVLSGFSFQLFLSCLLLPPILLLLPLSDWLLQSSWNLQPLLALSREGRGWGD